MQKYIEAPWIFISYRRGEMGHWMAALLVSKFEEVFGRNSTFFDAGSISGGQQWDSKIRTSLEQSMIVVTLINKDWKIESLYHSNDWVFEEIRLALENNLFLLPVVMEGSKMPLSEDLPKEVEEFARRQAYFIDSRSVNIFDSSIKAISEDIKNLLGTELSIKRKSRDLEIYSWIVYLNNEKVLTLTGSENTKTISIKPGIYDLRIEWHEKARDRYYTQGMDRGMTCKGCSILPAQHLWPGSTTFSLELISGSPKTLTNALSEFFTGQREEKRAIVMIDRRRAKMKQII